MLGGDDATAEAAELVLAAVPIGDAEDASPRLRRALAEAEVIAAEDTRRLRRLVTTLGLTPTARVVSYFEGNEERRTAELVAELEAGRSVLLVTDAGMPSVSDPGFRLVDAAVRAGVRVRAVPGPSAVLTALAVSGLPCDRFCFEGFPPRKSGARRRVFAALADEQRTLVFFESPHRCAATLRDLAAGFGDDRRAAACRELTKTHEEIARGTLAELVQWAEAGLRGELTLVVAGAEPEPIEIDPAELAAAVAAREATGEDRKSAIAATARAAGVPKRTVYDAVLAARGR